MNDILDVIFRRRSIRKFTDQPLEKDTLVNLLKAGMAAPSADNNRPWEFVVVTEPEILTRLRNNLRWGDYNTPAAIVVCSNPAVGSEPGSQDFWVQDCSAALENILIAATGMDLGTCWIGVYPLENVMRVVSQAVNLPEGVTPLGIVYVGHPAQTREPRTQYDENRVHWQQY